jgi:hypothetical protein
LKLPKNMTTKENPLAGYPRCKSSLVGNAISPRRRHFQSKWSASAHSKWHGVRGVIGKKAEVQTPNRAELRSQLNARCQYQETPNAQQCTKGKSKVGPTPKGEKKSAGGRVD